MQTGYSLEKGLFEDLEESVKPAGNLLRLLNLVIDTILIYVFTFLLLIVCALLFNDAYDEVANSDSGSLLMLNIVYLFAHVIYYTVMEGGIKGYTFGKMITRTYVVKAGGEPASWANAFSRSLIRLIPFEGFSILGDGLWHDKWTGTIVAKK